MTTLIHMADTPPGGPPPPPAPAVPSSDAAAPRMPLRRLGWRRVLALAGVVLLIAACAVYMLYTLGSNLGLDALLVGVTAAILPVPVLVACFLWLDRYEPEPLKYLIFCFAWGAFVSTAASLTVNNSFAALFEDWGLPSSLTGGAGGAVHRGVDQGARPDPAVDLPPPGVVRDHRRPGLLRALRGRVRHGGEHPLSGRPRLRLGRRPVRAGHRRPATSSSSSSSGSC